MPITFATVGTMAAPGFYVRRGAGLRKVKLPNTCAVVERPNGLLLIDTGWSRAQCAAPVRNPGRFRKWALSLNVRPGDELASQLRTMGYVASDVRDIVVTHLHVDHVGGIDDFPLARVHLSRAEWAQRARRGIRGYDPRTGKELWRLGGSSKITAPTPIFSDGVFVIASGRAPERPKS